MFLGTRVRGAGSSGLGEVEAGRSELRGGEIAPGVWRVHRAETRNAPICFLQSMSVYMLVLLSNGNSLQVAFDFR